MESTFVSFGKLGLPFYLSVPELLMVLLLHLQFANDVSPRSEVSKAGLITVSCMLGAARIAVESGRRLLHDSLRRKRNIW